MLSVLFTGWKTNFMEADKTRSIRLPEKVWDALDADAARCRRSSQKQIEALLVSFYEMGDVEINQESLTMLGEIMSHGKKTIKMLKETTSVEKRKAS